MFAEALQRGLAAGGWVIGLLASLGVFLLVIGTIGLALSYALGGKDDEEDEDT